MARITSRNVRVGGRRTSLRLEPEFWEALQEIAAARRTGVDALIDAIAAERPAGRSLTSAVRVFVFLELRRRRD
jgi:predicted DNA-binding ribbon-helix-helix protein